MEVELGSDVEVETEVEVAEGKKSRIKIEKLFDFEPRGYYVYVHRKMTNGEIFYVGKGKGRKPKERMRALSLAGRTELWTRSARKYGVTCEIVLDNLTEEYALELEREFIAFYGRISTNDGCLTNFLSIGNNNPGASGVLNPRADKRVYHFVNIHTFESFIGCCIEFKEVKGFAIRPVVTGRDNSMNGWTTMEIMSTTDLNVLRHPRAGERHRLYDGTVYRFYNMLTEEEMSCNRHEFEKIAGSRAVDLLVGAAQCINDWCLYENKHKWYSSRTDYKRYLFVHEDGRQYITTRNNFKKETGVDTHPLFNGQCNRWAIKGWRVIR